MKANGNFSDARLKRFYSVRINRMCPSDAVDLGRPCSSLFQFQVVHRYVFSGVIQNRSQKVFNRGALGLTR